MRAALCERRVKETAERAAYRERFAAFDAELVKLRAVRNAMRTFY
jgi:hypothetical protein